MFYVLSHTIFHHHLYLSSDLEMSKCFTFTASHFILAVSDYNLDLLSHKQLHSDDGNNEV